MTLIPPRLPDYLVEWQDPVGDLVVLNQQGHWECTLAMVEHLFDVYRVGEYQGVRLHSCGSEAGYHRHRRRGEAPCSDCKQAHSRGTYGRLSPAQKARRALLQRRRRARLTLPVKLET